MNRIQTQAAKLWQLLAAPDTFASYKQAVIVTWDILRETLILFWLVICLVLVAGEWFWSTSINTGRTVRSWFNNFEGADTNQLASETGKALLMASKSSVDYTLSQAREQLGFPAKEVPEVPAPAPVAPPAPPAPVAKQQPEVVVAPTQVPEPPAVVKPVELPEDEDA